MSHSQFHSMNLFILRHAWLNLWDKHMTTGRINQVTISATRAKLESAQKSEFVIRMIVHVTQVKGLYRRDLFKCHIAPGFQLTKSSAQSSIPEYEIRTSRETISRHLAKASVPWCTSEWLGTRVIIDKKSIISNLHSIDITSVERLKQ